MKLQVILQDRRWSLEAEHTPLTKAPPSAQNSLTMSAYCSTQPWSKGSDFQVKDSTGPGACSTAAAVEGGGLLGGKPFCH
jgi:hypothetical protein